MHRGRNVGALLLAATTAMMLVAAPALAGGEPQDLESVRATVLETVDTKTDLVEGLLTAAETEEAEAIYRDALTELGDIRDRGLVESDIDELWALERRAKGVYAEAAAAGAEAGKPDEELLAEARAETLGTIEYKLGYFAERRSDTDDPTLRRIYAEAIDELAALKRKAEASSSVDELRQLKARAHEVYETTKDRAEDPDEYAKTEAEQAAERLAKARRSVLRLIERKVAIFRAAAEATAVPAVADIYRQAMEDIAALATAAKEAKGERALDGIEEQVGEIYEGAVDAVEAFGGHGPDDEAKDRPAVDMEAHLDRLVGVAERLLAVADETAEASPDTFETVVDAFEALVKTTDRARDVADSGKGLEDRWHDVKQAKRDFVEAFVEHVKAITDVPMKVFGMYVPA